MAIFLNIDTAVETASVCLSDNSEPIGMAINENQKDHAAWLHTAVRLLLQESGLSVNDLNAIAISIGPGSYTGLRVGLSAAKGLCYALDIPLITIGTLKIMAHAVNNGESDLVCPMIDARRMEVFAAVYDKTLIEINKPFAMIVNEKSFADELASHKIIFCGNGSNKLQTVLSHHNAIFNPGQANAANMPLLANVCFREKKFAGLAYVEPLYVKEFYSPVR